MWCIGESLAIWNYGGKIWQKVCGMVSNSYVVNESPNIIAICIFVASLSCNTLCTTIY